MSEDSLIRGVSRRIGQRWSRILPVTFVMYTIAFVDRTNVSLALPEMTHDLRMDSTQAGIASGFFFFGYVLLQLPSGYLASRWSPRALVGIMLIGWGTCALAAGFVHSWRQFLLARFLLGVFEGGVWPSTLVLVSRWFPRAERARANAYWMLCLPAAVVFSSPISGWILAHWNWRVLLASQGILPILWLIVWMTTIDDDPETARWISSEERAYLREAAQLEHREAATIAQGKPTSLFFRQVLLMMAISFLVSAGNYGYLFWLPSLLGSSDSSRHDGTGHVIIGLLNALPYAMAAIGMVFVSRRSDRHRERSWHVAASLAWAGLSLIAGAVLASQSPILTFALLCVSAAGSYGMLGPFWSIPSETLPAALSGLAIGMIQFSNVGGAFGPALIGYLQKRSGSFTPGFVCLGACDLLAAVLCPFLRRNRLRELNAGRRRARDDAATTSEEQHQ